MALYTTNGAPVWTTRLDKGLKVVTQRIPKESASPISGTCFGVPRGRAAQPEVLTHPGLCVFHSFAAHPENIGGKPHNLEKHI